MRELLVNAAAAGAPCASSRPLAKKMTDAVPLGGEGLIVEVGAGTGVVTQALLDRGTAAHRLLIVERAPLLFAHLCRRFPNLNVLLGDAALLALTIPDEQSIDHWFPACHCALYRSRIPRPSWRIGAGFC